MITKCVCGPDRRCSGQVEVWPVNEINWTKFAYHMQSVNQSINH